MKEKNNIDIDSEQQENFSNEAIQRNIKEISDYKYAIDESSIVSITDQNGIIKHVNSNFCRISGFSEDELLCQNYHIVNSGFHSKDFFRNLWDTICIGNIWKGEIRNKTKLGTYFWVDTTIVPFLDEFNKPYQFVAIKTDITSRVNAEELILSSLREKEVLLKELYHRTKNNMQVISSLLNLKAASVQDKNISDILEEMGNRIKSIALVHQKLYQSQNISSVDLKEYITDLADLLINSYSPVDDKVKLILDLENINVEIDTAIPCGLIINELITNSLKYAFPGDMKGEIRVHLFRPEPGFIELKVSDNGLGIPGGYDFEKLNTLGLQVFKNIAEEQLRGEVIYETQKGVSCTIRFRNN
jgi:PAS domain S-box-containing protein